ncbi:DUF2069 domain-containing protein [Oxalicibacterium faecigallinarum]|uniref:Membrane protein n=1 Tax=Oxalicibacterium faecigallinarum TaxID=573741 RepID=A0A8J3F0Z9_9BURK|nr:DUF2069 domain-containing protein [Oxalicibacterium faecigallinarum]GGI16066.1 membrane protein [Oxalicibacterium faecigallinarum]
MNTQRQQLLHGGAVCSLVALILLCIAWETILAPVRPGVFWPALKVLPLLLPLRGVLRTDLYTMQWSSMLILLYFMEGIVRGWSDSGLSALLGWMEVGLVLIFFTCVVSFLYPYKKAARAKMRAASISKQ